MTFRSVVIWKIWVGSNKMSPTWKVISPTDIIPKLECSQINLFESNILLIRYRNGSGDPKLMTSSFYEFSSRNKSNIPWHDHISTQNKRMCTCEKPWKEIPSSKTKSHHGEKGQFWLAQSWTESKNQPFSVH